jgi:hypothetical protein
MFRFLSQGTVGFLSNTLYLLVKDLKKNNTLEVGN